MKQRIITGIIFTLVITAIVIPGYWLPVLLYAFYALLAFILTRELQHTFAKAKIRVSPLLPLFNALIVLLPMLLTQSSKLATVETGPLLAGITALVCFFIFVSMGVLVVAQLIAGSPQALPHAAVNALLTAYIAFPLSNPVIILTTVPDGYFWMLLGLVTPWVSDTFAFFVGTMFGRHKIVPRLSPKKTIEGSIGGIMGTILFVGLYFLVFMRESPTLNRLAGEHLLLIIIAGTLFSVASQMGDWLASAIKRWCGVKDFGTILPGHGGILDRFDSVLFTMPVALMVTALAVFLFTKGSI